mmetsp:Transcript_32015/g.72232  ORF Transcript_32015/g.72232 Transcript_32015/m.72232 type:complete len:344 (+) Transcript_32015:1163-2194(+)
MTGWGCARNAGVVELVARRVMRLLLRRRRRHLTRLRHGGILLLRRCLRGPWWRVLLLRRVAIRSCGGRITSRGWRRAVALGLRRRVAVGGWRRPVAVAWWRRPVAWRWGAVAWRRGTVDRGGRERGRIWRASAVRGTTSLPVVRPRGDLSEHRENNLYLRIRPPDRDLAHLCPGLLVVGHPDACTRLVPDVSYLAAARSDDATDLFKRHQMRIALPLLKRVPSRPPSAGLRAWHHARHGAAGSARRLFTGLLDEPCHPRDDLKHRCVHILEWPLDSDVPFWGSRCHVCRLDLDVRVRPLPQFGDRRATLSNNGTAGIRANCHLNTIRGHVLSLEVLDAADVGI